MLAQSVLMYALASEVHVKSRNVPATSLGEPADALVTPSVRCERSGKKGGRKKCMCGHTHTNTMHTKSTISKSGEHVHTRTHGANEADEE